MQSVVDELKHCLTPFYSSILQNRFMFLVVAIGEFKGAQGGGACPLPPRTWPATSSRRDRLAPLEYRKTFPLQGLRPDHAWEAYGATQTPSWWRWGWLLRPREPHPFPRFRPFGPRTSPSPVTRGGLAPANMMGCIRSWF